MNEFVWSTKEMVMEVENRHTYLEGKNLIQLQSGPGVELWPPW